MEVCRNEWEWLGFRIPCRELSLEITLEALEPIRIGIGKTEVPSSTTDMPVYRSRLCKEGACEEIPSIPGSSLKGVLRTSSMLLTLSCNVERVHSGVSKDNCVNVLMGSDKPFNKLKAKAREGDMVTLKQVLKGFCPTCLLYGAPGLLSKLFVSEFAGVPGTVRILAKTGVAINRRTGASAGGLLYNVEYVDAGARFSGVLRALNTPNWMLALLAASLLAVHKGFFKVGGFKSRGMGRVSIVVNSETPVVELRPGSLEPLDADIDRKEELPKGCETGNDYTVCRGESAMNLLEKLSSSWHEYYCGKLRETYTKRFEEASIILEDVLEW